MEGDKVRVDPKHPKLELDKRLSFGGEIDSGGVGIIRKAFDSNLLRTVAVKMLLPEHAQDESLRGRLVEEAQITSQLKHPHIVAVHELANDRYDELFFSMDFVEGKTLTDILEETELAERTNKQLFEHLQIFLKVCDAVAYAHSRGIIHRDLKPSNVMVGKFGAVYVLDWGIARKKDKHRLFDLDTADGKKAQERYRIKAGQSPGTWKYMAPEQAAHDGGELDERTDVFQLGGVLYQILTHEPPYEAESLVELVEHVLEARIKPPEQRVEARMPLRLCQIATRTLRCAQDERYQSVLELEEEVERYIRTGGQFETTRFEQGALIVREGEPGQEAYIIVEGRCSVYTERTPTGERKVFREMGAGEVFGETAVLTDDLRTATVEALEPTDVMVITEEDFSKGCESEAWIGTFLKVLAGRFKEKDQQVMDLEQELADLKSRLAKK